MRLLLLTTLLAAALSQALEPAEDDVLSQWELFKIEFEKEYVSKDEEQKRLVVFKDNLNFVRDHNAKYQRGEVTFDVAVNHFSDLTVEEFAARMNGYKQPEGVDEGGEPFQGPDNVEVPATFDWRKKGAVTPIKNQGECGSCWAFSTTGSVEGQHFLKNKKLVSLSEQNLVDCSKRGGNDGCNGGFMTSAYRYIRHNKGIDTEKSYPYEGKDDTCRYNANSRGATVSGYVILPHGNEKKLKVAVATKGPISVAIDASLTSFMHYKSGVYQDPNCSSKDKDLDHAVLAIGYGTAKKGGAYWLVKNSWGTHWGMKGYVLMARNRKNMCGIASEATYPTV